MERRVALADRARHSTVDDFDALLAAPRHRAPVPLRQARRRRSTAIALRGVYQLHDQTDALRLVAFVDRLYDAQVRIVASGIPLDEVFADDMMAGGYRKKYLRAISRMIALTTGELPPHDESTMSVARVETVVNARPGAPESRSAPSPYSARSRSVPRRRLSPGSSPSPRPPAIPLAIVPRIASRLRGETGLTARSPVAVV